MNEEREETMGELYDRLPPDQWVFLPEFEIRFKKLVAPELPEGMDQELEWDATHE